ncbi:MAG: hypothetical protein EP335_12185 [Alphaproteobacteria bacterium]|nr:MAG: hypothetical protein EP335_12185 [Alphaproteobacteria bacterium]
MKLIHVVFGLLLVVAGITGYVLLSVPPENAVGLAHPTIAGMRLGGDGLARLGSIGDAPFYFQIAVILLATFMLAMGVAPKRRTRGFWLFLAGGALIAFIVWASLYLGYKHYLLTGETGLFFGVPVPTAWMLGGVWGSFALFDIFYAVAFRRYFLHPDDERDFEALVAEMKAGGEAN